MRAPNICIAGIEPVSGRHIRPVLEMDQLSSNFLESRGGCVNMANALETGPLRLVQQRPEAEDHLFDSSNLRKIGPLEPDEFWKLLLKHKKDSLDAIFGDALFERGSSRVVRPNTGNASLGLIMPKKTPEIMINVFNGRKRIRVRFFDNDTRSFLSLTDLRFYENDTDNPSDAAVENVSQRLTAGVKVILSLGLTRAWRKPDEIEEFHWLQVNNVHLEDDPAWGVQ